MPNARPLGNTAKHVVQGAANLNRANVVEAFEIASLIHAGSLTEAIARLKRVAGRDMTAHAALVLLLADKPKEAQDALIDGKIGE